MKSDLDRLMAERGLDGLLVLGDSSGNTVMNYLTNGASLERALVFKRRGGPLTLVHGGMERDNAAATGLALIDRDAKYGYYTYLQRANGDALAAQVAYLHDVLADNNLHGRIGIYGMFDAGAALAVLNQLQDRAETSELVGEFGETLFSLARETKDDWEIAQMQEAGRLTCLVVGETQEFIQGHAVRGDTVVRADGEPLTIGDVHRFTHSRVIAHGMTEDHHIFAQGRDAGVPHNQGTPDMPLQLGQPIVFDIFPKTASGYYHDMTRTWSLGYATDEVQELWRQCKEIFDKVMGELAVGKPCRDFQVMTLDYFEQHGHPTSRTRAGTHDGYMHGLGHSLGLDIHETPQLNVALGNNRTLAVGHVFSVEPGLYYPGRGIGIRIEDTVAFIGSGELINLTAYPYDLVVPMKR